MQPTPAADTSGFLKHFEMMQGLFNYGGTRDYLQARFGQLFNLHSAGFAGTDRLITETTPLIFESANSFNPGEPGKGVSVEYTLKGLTTIKAFAAYQSAPELEEVGGIEPESQRSRTYGFALEKVIGSKGLSGVQFQFAGGYTPVALNGQFVPALRFQRYSLFANKTFLDKRNVERLNVIGGAMFLRDNRLLDDPVPERSRGYGYFIEANWIPLSRLGLVTKEHCADRLIRPGSKCC